MNITFCTSILFHYSKTLFVLKSLSLFHFTFCVYMYIVHCMCLTMLKELEHKKLDWKVLTLKYDLGNTLSKEMWCKMDDTKNVFDCIKDEKCM